MNRIDIRIHGILFILILIAIPAPAASKTTPVREADAVCAQCHEKLFRTYLETPMANASGPATERLFPGTFFHARSGVEYRISSEGNEAWLAYRKLTDPTMQGRERLDYFLGSGHLGVTYLYSKNSYLLESPIAYYSEFTTYDMKPGLANIEHMPGALTINATCLRCHMSSVQRPGRGTEDLYQGLPFLHTGITCESCHGDTRQHVTTRGAVAAVNPGKLTPQKRDSICIVCHLEGATSVERSGRSVVDFEPGQDISEYISYFDYASGNTTRRGVSEVEQFLTSQCKRTTVAAMSCTNCHDPHSSPAPEKRAAFYRSKCVACHSAPKYAIAHHSSNPDCTSCHMPKNGAKNIPHVAWTDHRILQRPAEADAAESGADVRSELMPILSAGAGSRDLALAYYNLAVNGNTLEKPRAVAMLTAAAPSSANDSAVLRALAVLSEWNGDSNRAAELYRKVLATDPDSLTATVNLGTLMAKAGKYHEAETLWQKAFARNEDIQGLGQNLATLECILGDKSAAIDVLKRMLIYSPDIPELRNRLRSIEGGTQACEPPSSTGAGQPNSLQ